MVERLVKARATRTADMVASVPDVTMRRRSIDGSAARIVRPRSSSTGVGAP